MAAAGILPSLEFLDHFGSGADAPGVSGEDSQEQLCISIGGDDTPAALFPSVSAFGKPVPEGVARRLCSTAKDILAEEGNIVKASSPCVIVGDIHGQYLDLLKIFAEMGEAPQQSYVFLGDYVDRGCHSVETIQLLIALKITQVYGFYDEVLFKYGNAHVWTYYTDLFDYLPIACLIDGVIFCTHGGLSPSVDTLDNVRELDRVQEIPHDGAICDLLWSDPVEEYGWSMSTRGAGYLFGPDVTEKFAHENGLDMLVRAHQLVMPGYNLAHNGRCATVFSAPRYCGRIANQGAIMSLDSNKNYDFRQFAGCVENWRFEESCSMLHELLLHSGISCDADQCAASQAKAEQDFSNPDLTIEL